MKRNLFVIILFFITALASPGLSFSEEIEGGGLDDLFGALGGEEDQVMEEEETSTSSAIRGLNPVSEKYGAAKKNLSRYIRDVKAMENRRITKKELRKFLKDVNLGGKTRKRQKRK